ncbi:MAG TPA: ABC transporter permease subunit [Ornithinibacter sp.]|jgi:ABC-type transport system involved in multi-copper enzyme maturation permease subunit|uniref:ABC transporter permease subunit n=1 Tax=Ornithinibacter sp. TaxID=2862748 RepID=UPI002BDDE720|nr:ABC transporter permease subunit [Ornithinibacter sp.]HQV81962.1 ABC transporter permease subunit [Ornithinibacter sp.]HQW72522.1 ABC transporter permease subunit [Ornithinibacter sp.]HQX86103.1 ABC transporter permease subunit [Ornithinibacter sp.]HRA24826.1 ABC transporter permease subunit [Ornithinibacter sp.]
MIPAIRSEFRKFFTTRLWWGMAVGIFLAGAAFAALFGFLLTSEAALEGTPGAPTGDATQIANSVYLGGLGVGYLLLLTIGVLQIGGEYRHKTITSTLLSTPKRLKAMLAKVVALLGIGVVYGLISLLGSVSVGAIILNLRGQDPFPSTAVLRALALSLLVLGLWALIGLGIGILIPNQVAALLIGIGVAWIVEPLLNFAMTFWEFGRENIVQYMPTSATNAVVNAVQSSPDEVRLEWWAAALVLAGYAALLSGFGIWRTTRADIS